MIALTLALGVSASMPHAAAAAEEEDEHYDARAQGYTLPNVESKSSSVGMVWVLMLLMGAGCIGVMFMNPKRSHLD